MRLVNQKHPLRNLLIGEVLPYLSVFEPILPASCVDWLNGTGMYSSSPTSTPTLKASKTMRKTAFDKLQLSGLFQKMET